MRGAERTREVGRAEQPHRLVQRTFPGAAEKSADRGRHAGDGMDAARHFLDVDARVGKGYWHGVGPCVVEITRCLLIPSFCRTPSRLLEPAPRGSARPRPAAPALASPRTGAAAALPAAATTGRCLRRCLWPAGARANRRGRAPSPLRRDLRHHLSRAPGSQGGRRGPWACRWACKKNYLNFTGLREERRIGWVRFDPAARVRPGAVYPAGEARGAKDPLGGSPPTLALASGGVGLGGKLG